MQRVRVGIIGAGGIAQIEHVPNLLRLKHQFEILGVYDPSLTVKAFLTRKFELPVFENIETLLALPLDAVVIASPDALHHEQILAAFALGLHVFCEKPLCYSVADIDDVIAARDVARKVLQVGYMKRFDPSYQAALACLPGTAENLRYRACRRRSTMLRPRVISSAYSNSPPIGMPRAMVLMCTLGKSRRRRER